MPVFYPSRCDQVAALRQRPFGAGERVGFILNRLSFLDAAVHRALAENGCLDRAYALLLRDDYPSWLYQVRKGAAVATLESGHFEFQARVSRAGNTDSS
jgi:hypothetical protein